MLSASDSSYFIGIETLIPWFSDLPQKKNGWTLIKPTPSQKLSWGTYKNKGCLMYSRRSVTDIMLRGRLRRLTASLENYNNLPALLAIEVCWSESCGTPIHLVIKWIASSSKCAWETIHLNLELSNGEFFVSTWTYSKRHWEALLGICISR